MVQEHMRMDFLNPFWSWISALGNGGCIWIITAILLLISKKKRKVGFMCLYALLFSHLLNIMILKKLFMRARPYEIIDQMIVLIPSPRGMSFPSGHTATAFACAWTMWKQLPKKIGGLAMILASLIGFSRLYLGVHYPTDVIAGVLIGMIASIVVDMGSKQQHMEKVNRI